jgi:hypothetical protein
MASDARPPRSRAKEKRSPAEALADPPAAGPRRSLFSTAQSLIHINPPLHRSVTESGMLSEQTVRTRTPRAVMSFFEPHQCTLRRQRCCIQRESGSCFLVSRSTLGKRWGCAKVVSSAPRSEANWRGCANYNGKTTHLRVVGSPPSLFTSAGVMSVERAV